MKKNKEHVNAEQVEDDCVVNFWPLESWTSFLPSSPYFPLSDRESNRAKHNVLNVGRFSA